MSAELTLDRFRRQVYQGVGGYVDVAAGQSHALVSVGGVIFRLTFSDTEVTISDLNPLDRNNATAWAYFCQAESYLVIQNGVDLPFIYDGSTLRRSRTGANNPDLTVAQITQSGTTATVETAAPHPFVAGDYIELAGPDMPAVYSSQFYVESAATPTTFTIELESSAPDVVTGDLVARYCPEVPVGTIMAYGQGRLFVASADFTEMVAGDLVQGDIRNQVANLLRFTETTYLSEGGAFRLPTPAGRITGLSFVATQDTATGQGDLTVYGEHGAGTLYVSLPREQWKDQAIQRVLFTNIGCTSQDSIVDVNGDQFFRSLDGERSYRMARAEFSSYGQTPLSAEVSRVLDLDNPDYLDRASGVLFDNRLIFTCAPRQAAFRNEIASITVEGLVATVETERPHNLSLGEQVDLESTAYLDGTHNVSGIVDEVTFTIAILAPVPSELDPDGAYVKSEPAGVEFSHDGLIALDFTPLASMSNKTPAAYQGGWYGPDAVRQVFTLTSGRDKRAFFIGSAEDGSNSVWEITQESGPDVRANGTEVPVPAWLESRAFDCQSPTSLKRLVRGDIWLSDLVGDVDFRVYYRPDQNPTWTLWYEFTVTGPAADGANTDPLSKIPVTGAPRYRTQVTLPPPADTENVADGRLLRCGFTFQVRLEWTGVAKVEKFLIYANELVEGLQMGAQR